MFSPLVSDHYLPVMGWAKGLGGNGPKVNGQRRLCLREACVAWDGSASDEDTVSSEGSVGLDP